MPPVSQAELLAADGFARGLGVRLVTAGNDRVVVAMTIDTDHLQAGGRIHPAAAFGLADCAMSLISNAETRAFAVAAHFVLTGSASPGQTMTATAVPAHRTRGRVTWAIDVSIDGDRVATFSGTTLEVPA